MFSVKNCCIVFVLIWSVPYSSLSSQKKGFLILKKVLNKYQSQSIYFKIQKKLYLPLLGETIKENGNFYIENKKFRLQMNGVPSYLMIFDGQQLWYQPDINEKIVFKLKDHPHIYLLFRLFNFDTFLEHFSIKSFEKKSQHRYSFHVETLKDTYSLQKISLEVGHYIEEIHLFWEDLGQWQKYKFLNPWVKNRFTASKFRFLERGFEVISKNSL